MEDLTIEHLEELFKQQPEAPAPDAKPQDRAQAQGPPSDEVLLGANQPDPLGVFDAPPGGAIPDKTLQAAAEKMAAAGPGFFDAPNQVEQEREARAAFAGAACQPAKEVGHIREKDDEQLEAHPMNQARQQKPLEQAFPRMRPAPQFTDEREGSARGSRQGLAGGGRSPQEVGGEPPSTFDEQNLHDRDMRTLVDVSTTERTVGFTPAIVPPVGIDQSMVEAFDSMASESLHHADRLTSIMGAFEKRRAWIC